MKQIPKQLIFRKNQVKRLRRLIQQVVDKAKAENPNLDSGIVEDWMWDIQQYKDILAVPQDTDILAMLEEE